MTIKETINYLKEKSFQNYSETPYIISIKALEKQIPVKPIKNKFDPYQWFCPNCDSIIGTDGQEYETNYCCDCGQALDWE